MTQRACIFIGPSCPSTVIPESIDVFGPARLGSIYRAVEHGYRSIILIDGEFGLAPSVWHKEILFGLSLGASIVGGSSIGALRAAEMRTFGMIGVGLVYRLYSTGWLTADDEVSVLHAPRYLRYRTLSIPLINIRCTLAMLRRRSLISREQARTILGVSSQIFFPKRTLDSLRSRLSDVIFSAQAEELVTLISDNYVDQKALDAGHAIRLADTWQRPQEDPKTVFVPTIHWEGQFIKEISDIPSLERES